MFTSKSTILKWVVPAFAFAIVVLIVPHADAASFSLGTGAAVQGSLGEDLVKFTSKLALANSFMHIMLLIVLQMLGYLLQADFFNDPIMMGALNSIWQLSRDIMNVIFALMLIGVSFLVIITGKTDKAKEKVVNFVVAVVLVNFSWFFPRVILDIANVLTAAVYTIPNALPTGPCVTLDEDNLPTPCRVITDVLIFPTAAQSGGGFCGGPNSAVCACIDNLECHKTDTFVNGLATMTSSHAMLNGLAVSFARITMLARIPTSTATLGPTITTNQAVRVSFQVAMSVMLAFGIQLAVLLPLLGLAVGLFIRIIILWVTTAFMPFAFLGYVINGKLGTNVFEFETDIWKEFINAAFLPAMVAIPFVIGFIMLSAVAQIPAPPGMFGLTISMPILAGVKTWWQILWMMAAVGIIWNGAFKALSRSKIIGQFTDKIKGFGESVFSGLAQAPLLIPLPLPGGGPGTNLGTLVHGPKLLSDSVKLAASGTSGKSFGDIVAGKFGGTDTGPESASGVAENIKQGKINTEALINAIRALNAPGISAADRETKFKDIRTTLNITAPQSNGDTVKLLQDMIKLKDPIPQLQGIKSEIEKLTP